MSVNPGFGGRTFIPEALYKLVRRASALTSIDKKQDTRLIWKWTTELKSMTFVRSLKPASTSLSQDRLFSAVKIMVRPLRAMHAALRGFHKKGNV